MRSSPATIDRDKLQLLLDCGVDRLSMGVQSFDEDESRGHGPTTTQLRCSARALELLQENKFDTRNLDLIYGAENQSVASFLQSVQRVIDYGAEEIFLYPLYVRQLTVWANATSAQAMPWTKTNWHGIVSVWIATLPGATPCWQLVTTSSPCETSCSIPHLKLRQSIAAKRTE